MKQEEFYRSRSVVMLCSSGPLLGKPHSVLDRENVVESIIRNAGVQCPHGLLLNGFSAARSALCWVEIARLIYSLEASLEMQYRYWSDLKKS